MVRSYPHQNANLREGSNERIDSNTSNSSSSAVDSVQNLHNYGINKSHHHFHNRSTHHQQNLMFSHNAVSPIRSRTRSDGFDQTKQLALDDNSNIINNQRLSLHGSDLILGEERIIADPPPSLPRQPISASAPPSSLTRDSSGGSGGSRILKMGALRKKSSNSALLLSSNKSTTSDKLDTCVGNDTSTQSRSSNNSNLSTSPSTPQGKMWERSYRSFLKRKGLLVSQQHPHQLQSQDRRTQQQNYLHHQLDSSGHSYFAPVAATALTRTYSGNSSTSAMDNPNMLNPPPSPPALPPSPISSSLGSGGGQGSSSSLGLFQRIRSGSGGSHFTASPRYSNSNISGTAAVGETAIRTPGGNTSGSSGKNRFRSIFSKGSHRRSGSISGLTSFSSSNSNIDELDVVRSGGTSTTAAAAGVLLYDAHTNSASVVMRKTKSHNELDFSRKHGSEKQLYFSPSSSKKTFATATVTATTANATTANATTANATTANATTANATTANASSTTNIDKTILPLHRQHQLKDEQVQNNPLHSSTSLLQLPATKVKIPPQSGLSTAFNKGGLPTIEQQHQKLPTSTLSSSPSGKSPSSVTFTSGVLITKDGSPPSTAPLASALSSASNNSNNNSMYLYNPRFLIPPASATNALASADFGFSSNISQVQQQLHLPSQSPSMLNKIPSFNNFHEGSLRSVHEDEEDYGTSGYGDEGDGSSNHQEKQSPRAPEPPLFLAPIIRPRNTYIPTTNNRMMPMEHLSLAPFRGSGASNTSASTPSPPTFDAPDPPSITSPPNCSIAINSSSTSNTTSATSSAIKKAFTEFHNSQSTGHDAVSAFLDDVPYVNWYWAQRNPHHHLLSHPNKTGTATTVQQQQRDSHPSNIYEVNEDDDGGGLISSFNVHQPHTSTYVMGTSRSHVNLSELFAGDKSYGGLTSYNNMNAGAAQPFLDGSIPTTMQQPSLGSMSAAPTKNFWTRTVTTSSAAAILGLSTSAPSSSGFYFAIGPSIPDIGGNQTFNNKTISSSNMPKTMISKEKYLDTVHENTTSTTIHDNVTIHQTVRMLRPIQGVESWQTGRRYLIAPAALAACPPSVIATFWGTAKSPSNQSNFKDVRGSPTSSLWFQNAYEGTLPTCSLFGSIFLGECLLSYRPIHAHNSTTTTASSIGFGSPNASAIWQQQWSAAKLVLRQNYLLEYDPHHDFDKSCIPRGYIHLQHSTCYPNKDFPDALELHFYISPCAKSDKRILLIRIKGSSRNNSSSDTATSTLGNTTSNSNNTSLRLSQPLPQHQQEESESLSVHVKSIQHDDLVNSSSTSSDHPLESQANASSLVRKSLLRQQIEQEREHWITCLNKAASLRLEDLYEFPTSKRREKFADDSRCYGGNDDVNHDDSSDIGLMIDDRTSSPHADKTIKKHKNVAFDDDPSILGKGHYVTIRAARRRHNYRSYVSPLSKRDGEDDPNTYDCALKIFEKNEYWKMVVKGLERADTMVRETSVQATLTVKAGDSQGSNSVNTFLRLRGFFETVDFVVLELERLNDGMDLFQYVSSKGVLPEHEAAAVIRDVLSTLQVMNRLGMAHRDIKPANIIMRGNNNSNRVQVDDNYVDDQQKLVATQSNQPMVKVADFGMATFAGVDGHVRGRCGTPGYVAPEIFTAGLHGGYGNKVDVFSAGVTLYVMLCGYEPFYGETDAELIAANKDYDKSKLEFPSEEWHSVSQEAKDLVLQMMDPNPTTRCSAKDALKHPWLLKHLSQPSSSSRFSQTQSQSDSEGAPREDHELSRFPQDTLIFQNHQVQASSDIDPMHLVSNSVKTPDEATGSISSRIQTMTSSQTTSFDDKSIGACVIS